MALITIARRSLLAAGAALLASCATYQPVPEDYVGPRAVLVDSAVQESRSTGFIYAAVAIDGNRMKSAFIATNIASSGQGFSLTTQSHARDVPVRSMRITLRGARITAAPIHAIALKAKGELPEGEVEVEWMPKANMRYIVRGSAPVGGAVSLWIEEEASGAKVTPILTGK